MPVARFRRAGRVVSAAPGGAAEALRALRAVADDVRSLLVPARAEGR